eukprot:6387340-Prymnesium_polylepis.1
MLQTKINRIIGFGSSVTELFAADDPEVRCALALNARVRAAVGSALLAVDVKPRKACRRNGICAGCT